MRKCGRMGESWGGSKLSRRCSSIKTHHHFVSCYDFFLFSSIALFLSVLALRNLISSLFSFSLCYRFTLSWSGRILGYLHIESYNRQPCRCSRFLNVFFAVTKRRAGTLYLIYQRLAIPAVLLLLLTKHPNRNEMLQELLPSKLAFWVRELAILRNGR